MATHVLDHGAPYALTHSDHLDQSYDWGWSTTRRKIPWLPPEHEDAREVAYSGYDKERVRSVSEQQMLNDHPFLAGVMAGKSIVDVATSTVPVPYGSGKAVDHGIVKASRNKSTSGQGKGPRTQRQWDAAQKTNEAGYGGGGGGTQKSRRLSNGGVDDQKVPQRRGKVQKGTTYADAKGHGGTSGLDEEGWRTDRSVGNTPERSGDW